MSYIAILILFPSSIHYYMHNYSILNNNFVFIQIEQSRKFIVLYCFITLGLMYLLNISVTNAFICSHCFSLLNISMICVIFFVPWINYNTISSSSISICFNANAIIHCALTICSRNFYFSSKFLLMSNIKSEAYSCHDSSPI
jgi:hypothetical protein